MTFDEDIRQSCDALLALCRSKGRLVASAESCTGGLIAAALTGIPGSSDVVDCGFVTYSNDAKRAMLGISGTMLDIEGAVSEAVARAMAEGAIRHSRADLAVAVTGIAGPGGGTARKPVGLVWLATAGRGMPVVTRELRLGDIGRDAVRSATLRVALAMLQDAAVGAP